MESSNFVFIFFSILENSKEVFIEMRQTLVNKEQLNSIKKFEKNKEENVRSIKKSIKDIEKSYQIKECYCWVIT